MIRVIRAAMILSVVLYAFVAEKVAAHKPATIPSSTFYFAMASLAVIVSAAVILLRRIQLEKARVAITVNPADTKAMFRFRFVVIVSFALSESVALYGFVLRVLGFGLRQVLPFYVAALVLLFLAGTFEAQSTP